jgi:hypothetical protein
MFLKVVTFTSDISVNFFTVRKGTLATFRIAEFGFLGVVV